MSPSTFSSYASDRKLLGFSADTIERLWQAGLMRADIVANPEKLDRAYLDFVAKDEEGYFLYCDMRPVPYHPRGYGGILADTTPKPKGIQLFFHPFRLYLLYHFAKAFDVPIAPTQYLWNPKAFADLSNRILEGLDGWTTTEQCAEIVESWNRTAELAISLEPISYRRTFELVSWPLPGTEERIKLLQETHYQRSKALLDSLAAEEIDRFRDDLCHSADTIDDNRRIHLLLRMMSGHERLKLKSALGSAMLFISMAEIIRRAAEMIKGIQLREEDELGHVQWMRGARKFLYGSERILDASNEVRRDFLTNLGLGYGVKVRIYGEGSTEIAALALATKGISGAEFIDLRGDGTVKRKAFDDILARDTKLHIFSIILVDEDPHKSDGTSDGKAADKSDNRRIIEAAAKSDKMFGCFFVANPDFEFANFTRAELVEIVISSKPPVGSERPERDWLLACTEGAETGKAFFRKLEGAGISHVRKGKEWGEKLMSYALKNQLLPAEHKCAGAKRPMIVAAERIMQACRSGYTQSKDDMALNHKTGDVERR